jgi:hypothetical protein
MYRRKISVPDLVYAACGLLALVATFLPWWSISESATIGGQHVSDSLTVDGWNAASHGEIGRTITGPLVWVPMLLLLLLGALGLVRAVAAPQLLTGKAFYRLGTGVAGLGALLVIVRWATYFTPPSTIDAGGVAASAHSGASIGTYLGLLLALAVAADGIWALSRPPLGGDRQPDHGRQPYPQPGPTGHPHPAPYGQQPPATAEQSYPEPGRPAGGQPQTWM